MIYPSKSNSISEWVSLVEYCILIPFPEHDVISQLFLSIYVDGSLLHATIYAPSGHTITITVIHASSVHNFYWHETLVFYAQWWYYGVGNNNQVLY